jgi:phosphorylated CTD-interacting factor 1
MQAALPSYVFKCLNEVFEVKQEMFASPFNCYFRSYCSAFYDTDACFGSLGSFFDFEPSTHGSFQCNPPFTEEVIECMADRIDFLLETSKFALSFIVFIPEWLDPPTPGLVKMEKSHYMRVNFNIEIGKHKYVSGSQYLNNSSSSCFYSEAHNTRVFFLQNQSGYEMFTPTSEKLEMLKESMHSSK